MNIEKWVSYLIACLTMLIVAFNMVGSLWMIVLEKKHDLAILKPMGMTSDNIQGIFIRVGYLIAWLGLAIGLLLATLFYFLQKNFGLIGIPDGFMIDAYPIEFRFWDFILVIITVTVIAFVASYLPAKKAAQGNTYIKYE